MIYISELIEGKQNLTPACNVEFDGAFDVIVCGLGTAGSLAALFCAENDLKVLGIETATCVGGTHTVGGVGGHYFGCPGGRFEETEEEIKKFKEDYAFQITESRKYVVEKKLTDAGVAILYKGAVCGVYLEGKTAVGVRVITQEGIKSYRSKVIMDCTAEAYVAVMAGCKTNYGRASDGQAQPYSLVSLIYAGKYTYTNVDFGRVDQNDPKAFSQAILYSRAYLEENGHGGKDVIAPMPLMGFREGRRIVAEETVRLEDFFAGKFTQTPAYYAYADLDKHGWDIAFDGETIGDWAIGANLGAYNVSIPVPYQAILPVEFEGLLVPCRAVGVDRDISSCVRMNPDMKKLAECAAAWATLAVKTDSSLRQVPYENIKAELMATGCLKEEDNRGYRIDGRLNWDGTPVVKRDVTWITDPNDLERLLKTETPGEAIWSAKLMGNQALPVLLELIKSEDENLRKHTAFALAMLGNSEGSSILREMAQCRDGFMLCDCRKHNNLRGCIAIYWLGRLQDEESVPILTELITNRQEPEKSIYHQSGILTTRYAITNFNNLYFQFMSQAVMALVRIGDAHPHLQAKIADAFKAAFDDDAYYEQITSKPRQSSEGNMAIAIKKIAYAAAAKWNQ